MSVAKTITKYLPTIICAGTGLILGGGIGYSVAKVKYEKRLDTEIEEIKVALSKYYIDQFNKTDIQEEESELPEVVEETPEEKEEKKTEAEYTDYTAYFAANTSAVEEKPVIEKKSENSGERPYVIHPNEFGYDDSYELITLMYFKDHKLTDENGDEVDDVDDTIGIESLNHFGEYEDIENAIYICNDKTMCYYEVIKYDETLEEYLAKTYEKKGVL